MQRRTTHRRARTPPHTTPEADRTLPCTKIRKREAYGQCRSDKLAKAVFRRSPAPGRSFSIAYRPGSRRGAAPTHWQLRRLTDRHYASASLFRCCQYVCVATRCRNPAPGRSVLRLVARRRTYTLSRINLRVTQTATQHLLQALRHFVECRRRWQQITHLHHLQPRVAARIDAQEGRHVHVDVQRQAVE